MHDTTKPLVIEPEEVDRGRDVVLAPHAKADPPRVRLGAVRFSATGGHEVSTHPHRHQQIRDTAQMDVSDFPMGHMQLEAAEAIRPYFYAIPVLHDAGDTFAEVNGAHARHQCKTWTRWSADRECRRFPRKASNRLCRGLRRRIVSRLGSARRIVRYGPNRLCSWCNDRSAMAGGARARPPVGRQLRLCSDVDEDLLSPVLSLASSSAGPRAILRDRH